MGYDPTESRDHALIFDLWVEPYLSVAARKVRCQANFSMQGTNGRSRKQSALSESLDSHNAPAPLPTSILELERVMSGSILTRDGDD